MGYEKTNNDTHPTLLLFRFSTNIQRIMINHYLEAILWSNILSQYVICEPQSSKDYTLPAFLITELYY